jgi:hypothetical protein
MGIIGKLFGYPQPDSSGNSCEYFELAGKTAMKMATGGSVPRAIQHMDVFLMKQTQQFGTRHPDVGRGYLAKAALYYVGADLDSAETFRRYAEEVFESCPDKCSFELEAAQDFKDIIISSVKALAGEADKHEPEIEDRPFGYWLKRLEMG